MEEMRSKSYNSNYGHTTTTTTISNNNKNPKPENLRCHSASSSSYSSSDHSISNPNYKTNCHHHSCREDDFKNKKGKPSSVGWVLGDPAEMQRKKRVASYKAYTVEGKLKGSLKKSFRWIKMRYAHLVHGRS